jgi:hypothetical protein
MTLPAVPREAISSLLFDGVPSATMHPMPTGESPIYETRYGLNRQSATAIGACLAFCVVIIAVPAPLWARIFVAGFFGFGAVILGAASLTRKTALRIDSAGITLSTSPLRPRSTVLYPWEDVDRVLIWQYQRLVHVGVQRRDGAAPLPLRISGVSRAALSVTSPGIPPETAATAAPANGWSLDRERLASAIAHFAPAVEVVDTATGRLIKPPPPAENAGTTGP